MLFRPLIGSISAVLSWSVVGQCRTMPHPPTVCENCRDSPKEISAQERRQISNRYEGVIVRHCDVPGSTNSCWRCSQSCELLASSQAVLRTWTGSTGVGMDDGIYYDSHDCLSTLSSCICVHTYIHGLKAGEEKRSIRTCVILCTHIYIYIYMYVYLYTYICKSVYIYVYLYIYIYIIYICLAVCSFMSVCPYLVCSMEKWGRVLSLCGFGRS